MKIHSYTTVIRYFEKKKIMYSLWNYITALRGDDTGKEYFKIPVMCVIRGNCNNALDYSYAHHIVARYKSAPVSMIARVQNAFDTVSFHTIDHARNGLNSLCYYYANKHGKKYTEISKILERMARHVYTRDAEKYLEELNKLDDIIQSL